MSEIPSLAKQRRLNIIDDVRHYNEKDKALVERLHQDKVGSERIILGDDASFALGKWIVDCEEDIMRNLQFALPPFPKTYIELTIWRCHQGIDRKTSGPVETADDRIGFLIDGKHVRVMSSSQHGMHRPFFKHPAVGIFHYWLDTPETERLIEGPIEREAALRAALLFGTSAHALDDEAMFRLIVGSTRIRCLTPLSEKFLSERLLDQGRVKTRFEQLVSNCAGELRTMWAVLLLLNQHRHRIQTHGVPRETLVTARGRKVYMAHTLITIPIFSTPAETRKCFYPNTRASPVGHDVRAHWRDYHDRKNCTSFWAQGMSWPLLPDDDGRFQCPNCHGYRRRIASFSRGRSDVGYNLHTYEVTP